MTKSGENYPYYSGLLCLCFSLILFLSLVGLPCAESASEDNWIPNNVEKYKDDYGDPNEGAKGILSIFDFGSNSKTLRTWKEKFGDPVKKPQRVRQLMSISIEEAERKYDADNSNGKFKSALIIRRGYEYTFKKDGKYVKKQIWTGKGNAKGVVHKLTGLTKHSLGKLKYGSTKVTVDKFN